MREEKLALEVAKMHEKISYLETLLGSQALQLQVKGTLERASEIVQIARNQHKVDQATPITGVEDETASDCGWLPADDSQQLQNEIPKADGTGDTNAAIEKPRVGSLAARNKRTFLSSLFEKKKRNSNES